MWNSRSLSAWQDRYHTLTSREQTAIILALIAVFCFMLAQFIYFPMNAKLAHLGSSITAKEKDLSELKIIVSEYHGMKANKHSNVKTPAGPLSLFSVLEKLATKSGLIGRIDYMKPGSMQLDAINEEKWVEVKLSQIDLKELTDYLYNLQSFQGGIYIKRLSIRKDRELLNLILQPAIIEKK